MPDRQWLNKSFKAFEVAPPFQLRFLQVCLDKCAFAHLQLSTIHVSFKRFKKAEFSTDSKDAGLNRHWLANLLIHELGHLLGLYHSFEFTNDPVAVETKATETPNFMSFDIAFKSTLGFVDFQKRLIHSYLGGGRVFQQHQQVNFDALNYLELVKRYNGFQESPPTKTAKAGKISYRLKSDKIRTFDDDDDDEDDEETTGARGLRSGVRDSGLRGGAPGRLPARPSGVPGWKACAAMEKTENEWAGRACPVGQGRCFGTCTTDWARTPCATGLMATLKALSKIILSS